MPENDYNDDSTWTRMRKLNGTFTICLSGAFGGAAPNLFRIASDLTHGDSLPTWSYVIGVIIFAGMGAGIARFYKETDTKKAILLGLSIPAMFQNVANDVSSHSVEAAMITPAIEETGKVLILHPPNTNASPAFSVIFLFKDEQRREEIKILARSTNEHKEPFFVNIPPLAEKVILTYRNSRSAPVTISYSSKQQWDIEVTRNTWSGIQRSIGLKGVAGWEIKLVPHKEGKKK